MSDENGLLSFINKILGESKPEENNGAISEEDRRREEGQQRTLWDDKSELYAQPLNKKGLTADPSAAYGLLGFMGTKYDKDGNYDRNGSPLTLKLTGKFPKAQYMSLQIYRGKPVQTSEDVGDVLSDFKIKPQPGGENPFKTGNRNDEGTFEIVITPNENDKDKDNHIYYEPKDTPDNSAVISGFYRVYLPEGQEITPDDLPKITAVDSDGDSVHPRYVDLVNSWYLDIPGLDALTKFIFPQLTSLPWLNLNQVFSGNLEGLGASEDVNYITSFNEVPFGKYVVIKFRAPALYFGEPDPIGIPAVRYWSISPVYFPTLTGLNSLPCDPTRTESRDVTVVFGEEGTKVKAKARRMGAEFLPDKRESSEHVLTFLMRNVLPTETFRPDMFKGKFAPTGKVYSARDFLELPEDEV